MPLLDAFFAYAVPFVILCVIVALVARSFDRKRGIYRGAEGAARRDAINEKFGTNTGAVVIGVIFVALWGVTVAGLVGQWGATFFTVVISALLILPFFTVCAGTIMLYTFVIHGSARGRDR